MKQNQYVPKQNITLYNRLNNEVITGDLINEDEIEGQKFYVVRVNNRVLKLHKEAYTPKKMFAHR